jgi:hypothetical protein
VDGTGWLGVVSPAGTGPASSGKLLVFGLGLSGTNRLRRGEYMSSYAVPQPAIPTVEAASRRKEISRVGRDMPAGLLECRAPRQLRPQLRECFSISAEIEKWPIIRPSVTTDEAASSQTEG